MKKLHRSIDVAIDITPEELGEMFANAAHNEQIRALNAMAAAVAKWDTSWAMQIETIVRPESFSYPDRLTPEARAFMAKIGEYAYETTA